MNWLRKYWLWLVVNIIVLLPLIGVLSSFNLDFSDGLIPSVTVEQPDFPARPEFEQDTMENPDFEGREPKEHSALSFPIKTTGEWAIRWLVLSLTCTPLYILFGWSRVLTVKKVLGLYAFAYALLHTVFFLADRGFLAVFDEFNFVMGLLSLLIMVPLAITSNRWSMKSMGKGWKVLHRAVYAAGIFAVLHLAFLGEGSCLLYAVILALGFAIRIPQVRKTITGFRRTIFHRNPVPA